jgi:tungstate transport system permease protein
MQLVWEEFKTAVPLIFHGDPYLLSIIWFTLEVAVLGTLLATVIGLPVAVALGLGRFRGRAVIQWLANAGVAMPPVLAGLFLYIVFAPPAPLGGLHLTWTRRSVFIAQTLLAIPYVVALATAAIRSLPPGLISQARALGAGWVQVGVLAVREARVGVVAAIVAAMGTTLAEVGAIVVVGGNIYGYDQTLASAALFDAGSAHYADAIACGIVLIGLILILLGGASVLQERRVRV